MTKRVGIVATVGSELHLQTGVLDGGRLSPGIVLLPTSFVEMLLAEQFEQVVALALPGPQAGEAAERFLLSANLGPDVEELQLAEVRGFGEIPDSRGVKSFVVTRPVPLGVVMPSGYGRAPTGSEGTIEMVDRALNQAPLENGPRVVLRGSRVGEMTSLLVVSPVSFVAGKTALLYLRQAATS